MLLISRCSLIFVLLLMSPGLVQGSAPESLTNATHVVVGEVDWVYFWEHKTDKEKDGTTSVYRSDLVEVTVETVEKGRDIDSKQVIYVNFFRARMIDPVGGPTITPPAPHKGDRVRLHMRSTVKGRYGILHALEAMEKLPNETKK